MIRFARTGLRPWLMALLTLVLCTAAAPSLSLAAPQFPAQNNTRVVDDAGILSAAVERELDLKLKGLEDATTDQVVVVTVKDLQGYAIDDYGYQLGRAWGIGQKGQVQASNGQTYKNNGIVFLVAPNDRKVRIEVGYGLEPVMTDALSSIIIRNVVLPEFKAGNYEAGVIKGTDAIVEQLAMDRQVAVQKAQAAVNQNVESSDSKGGGFPMIIIIIILFVLFLFSPGWLKWFILGQLLSGGRGGGWSGGGGGGGGFSGGGGSFGGGGSSGSW